MAASGRSGGWGQDRGRHKITLSLHQMSNNALVARPNRNTRTCEHIRAIFSSAPTWWSPHSTPHTSPLLHPPHTGRAGRLRVGDRGGDRGGGEAGGVGRWRPSRRWRHVLQERRRTVGEGVAAQWRLQCGNGAIRIHGGRTFKRSLLKRTVRDLLENVLTAMSPFWVIWSNLRFLRFLL